MPQFGLDTSHIIPEKVKNLERTVRAKDERITALETENAMLYLKLAQLQGAIRNTKEETSHMRRLHTADKKFKDNLAYNLVTVNRQIKNLKSELNNLRSVAVSLPHQFNEEYDKGVEAAKLYNKKWLSDNLDMKELKLKMMEMERALTDAIERHAKEKKRRRELHNTLVELRGNIRVHCRVRPLMTYDTGSEDVNTLGKTGSLSEQVVHTLDDENVLVKSNRPGHAATNKTFEFERVYFPNETQQLVFEEVQPLLTSLLDGYNVCIMAYGQTGSGKTHTMLGPHYIVGNSPHYGPKEPSENDGVVPRAARELFSLIAEKPAGSHTVEVSVCEVYNNDIYDLLRPGSMKHGVITTNEGAKDVPSLTQRTVNSADGVVELVQYGMVHRCTDATLIHEHSSRSHLVVTLTVTSPVTETPQSTPTPSRTGSPTDVFAVPQGIPPGNRERRRQLPNPLGSSFNSSTGSFKGVRSRSPSPSRMEYMGNVPVVKTKLQLVDLAGSECVGMSGVTRVALRETQFINKSLCALADVLGALAEHRPHVPYRNSRLTHLLQDSIGGDSKLLVMLCVSPAQRYITESLQSLGFGSRARQVARGPIKKRPPMPGDGGLVSPTTDKRRPFSQRQRDRALSTSLSASISDSTPPQSPRQSPRVSTSLDLGSTSPGKGKGTSSRGIPSLIPQAESWSSKSRASPSLEQLNQSGRNSPRTRMSSYSDRR
ncbi:kinesin-like protein KIF25 isoform X3 [Ptychodera flava]|uniref:kinesin-like protein KIF25 isoform X3 n=1 Tax=Ptychodera flava TaxID=63121 RepID=UPI00396A43B7